MGLPWLIALAVGGAAAARQRRKAKEAAARVKATLEQQIAAQKEELEAKIAADAARLKAEADASAAAMEADLARQEKEIAAQIAAGRAEAEAMAARYAGYNILVNDVRPDSPTQYIYGRRRVGGVVTYGTLTNASQNLHFILALAGHEVQAISQVQIDGKTVALDARGFTSGQPWGDKIRVKRHLGTAGQRADPDLVSEVTEITADHRGRGIAYLYVRMVYDQDIFRGAQPAFTALVEGKKCRHWKKATAYTNNPVWCLFDMMSEFLGVTAAEIDAAAWDAAEKKCSDSGWTIAAAFTAPVGNGDVREIVDNTLRTFGGRLAHSGGLWVLRAAGWQAPAAELTQDHLISEMTVTGGTPAASRGLAISGKFMAADDNWIENRYPLIKTSTYADGGNVLNHDLTFVDSETQAEQLAHIHLALTSLEQVTVGASFNLSALQARPTDTVSLTMDHLGWDRKTFDISAMRTVADSQFGCFVTLSLRETSEAVYSWDSTTDLVEFFANDTRLSAVPPDVTLSIETGLRIANQEVVSVLTAVVGAPANARISLVEAEFKPARESQWRSMGTAPFGSRLDVLGIDDGSYDVRARAVGWHGEVGAWAERRNFAFAPADTPPGNVENLSREISGGLMFLSWDASRDLDLSHHSVRHGSEDDWAKADTVIERVARPSTSATVAVRSGFWMVKAFDKRGHESRRATSVGVLSSEIPSLGHDVTLSEAPAFSGAKNNTAARSRNRVTGLEITRTPNDGAYVFSSRSAATTAGVVDTGSVRTIRVSGSVTWAAHEVSDVLADDLDGDIDGIAGLWDDASEPAGLAQYASAVVQVRTTDSDPDGGSPGWTAWEGAHGQDLTARAIQLRALLKTDITGLTPRVTALRAAVSY